MIADWWSLQKDDKYANIMGCCKTTSRTFTCYLPFVAIQSLGYQCCRPLQKSCGTRIQICMGCYRPLLQIGQSHPCLLLNNGDCLELHLNLYHIMIRCPQNLHNLPWPNPPLYKLYGKSDKKKLLLMILYTYKRSQGIWWNPSVHDTREDGGQE